MGNGNQGGTPGTGLAPNVASVLCYICAPITSLIFILIEKENKDVQFHAWQGTLFGAAIIVINVVLNLFGLVMGRLIEFLGTLVLSFLIPVLWLGILVLWVVCLIKAYQGERWRIPVLGDIAAQKAKV